MPRLPACRAAPAMNPRPTRHRRATAPAPWPPGAPPPSASLAPAVAWAVAVTLSLATLAGCSHQAAIPAADPPALQALRAGAPVAYKNSPADRPQAAGTAAAVAIATPATPPTTSHNTASAATPATRLPTGPWWLAYGDPALAALIAQADAHNPRLAQAAARWAQARALLRGSQAARRPQLGLGIDASRQGGPLVNAAGGSGTLISAGATLGWELDLFGALAQADAAAQADADERQARLQGARLALQAELAQALLALRALDAEQALLQDQQRLLQEARAIARRQQAAGLAAESAGLQAASAAALLDTEAQALARRRGELVHALALMAGQPASGFSLAPVPPAARAANPAPPAWSPDLAPVPVVPAGLPSALMDRRPDLAAARSALQAAQARRGQAESARWPSLALTASGGAASPNLAGLLQASMRVWSLGAAAALPLLDGGRHQASLDQADAVRDEAEAAYRAAWLQALREVEDPLLALQTLAAEAAALARITQAAERSLALAQGRQQRGLASRSDTLAAQLALLQQQREAVRLHGDRLQASVALVRALGGGWDGLAAGTDGGTLSLTAQR